MHLNTNLLHIPTITLAIHLKRLERSVARSRQKDLLVQVFRNELECRAALRATQFGVASIHA